MATSNKWRMLITANAGYTGMVGIGDWELRTEFGVARPFVQNSMTAAVTDAGAAVLGGPAALTELVSAYTYGDMVALTLPFNIEVGTFTTNQVVVNGYGMVSFGHDGTTHGYAQGLDFGNIIPFPSIVHGSGGGWGASAIQRLYAGAENSGTTYRIRLEMVAGWDEPLDGVANTVWEMSFDSAFPDQIRVDFGTSLYSDFDGGLTAGIGDGWNAAHVGSFVGGVINKAYSIITTPVPADGTVTASLEDPTYNRAPKAIDGNQHTAWIANMTPSGGTPAWLQYEYTTPQTIEQYMVKASSSSAPLVLNGMPRDWTLQYWDGSAWQTQDTQTAQTSWSYGQERTYALVVPSNDGELTFPALTLVSFTAPPDTYLGFESTLTLLAPTLSATGFRSTDGQVILGNNNNLGPVYNLTPFTLAAVGHRGYIFSGEATFEELELEGSLEPALALPLLVIEALGVAGTISTGDASLSGFTLAAAFSDPLTFAELQLAATGLAGRLGQGDADLPFLAVDAVAYSGNAANGAVRMPLALLAASMGNDGAITWPLATMSGAMLPGTAALGGALLSRLTLDGSGTADQLPTDGSISWPDYQLGGILHGGLLATGSVLLAAPDVDATGQGAGVLDGTLLLAAPQVAGAGLAGPVAHGTLALPLWQASATASTPPPDNLASGALGWPQLALSAALLPGQLANGGLLALAAPTVAAALIGDLLADGALLLRAPTLSATALNNPAGVAPGEAAGVVTVAALAVAATGQAGSLSLGAALLAPLSLGGVLVGEQVGAASATLPGFMAAGVMAATSAPTSADAAISLPLWQVTGTLGAGNMADAALLLRAPVLSALAHVSNDASGALTLPAASVAASSSHTALIEGAVTLLAPSMLASAAPGNIGVASITVPLLRVDADGHADAVGTATVSLPLLELNATGSATVANPVFTGVAVNTRTQAASTYSGLDFNSVTSFNGMVLAATADGIVALAGDTDQGTAIAAMLASGVSGMESEQFKRVLCGYAGYSATGNLELTLITDTHHEYVYALVPEQIGQLHAARVKFGRGVDGRYWQWKLANKAGAHFALDALTLDITPLSRRT